MRPHCVIVPPPPFNHDLRFAQRIEQFSVEQLIPEFAIERFEIAVLPWNQGVRVLEIIPLFSCPPFFPECLLGYMPGSERREVKGGLTTRIPDIKISHKK